MDKTEVIDYIKKSFELKNQGYFKPAIEMLYKALSLDSDNIEILAQLAQLYKNLDNFQRALYYIGKVLELDKNHLDTLLLLKDIYLLQNKNHEALSLIEKIHSIQPSADNLVEKIKILSDLGEIESIKTIEQSGIMINDEVFYEIAKAHYNNRDKEKACELLELAYSKNKTNEKILNLLAVIYYEKTDFKNSKKLFSELEKINPSAQTMNYLGLFKLNEKKFSAAADYFLKALKEDGKNHEYIFNLASAYFLKGWLDEALKYFTQAVCLAPDNLDYHYSMAYLHYNKQDYKKASKELEFIKSVNSGHEQANILGAMILAKKGDKLSAKKQLEDIVNSNPTDDFALSELGKIYKELSQTDLAKKALEKAIELNPESLEYLCGLTEINIEQKDFEVAQKTIEKMLKLNKKCLYAHIAQCKINVELKDFNSVYDSAQDIINLDQSCPEGYYYNAVSLFATGDKDFAIASLKKAVSLDLNNPELYMKMSEFYQELGDFKYAYEWAIEASEIEDKSYKYKWICAKLASTLNKKDEATKYFSQSYRLASFDKDLANDYSKHLISIGKEKQARAILK